MPSSSSRELTLEERDILHSRIDELRTQLREAKANNVTLRGIVERLQAEHNRPSLTRMPWEDNKHAAE